ncbi:hypothetical protein Droror1_Dr00028035, partial [Drosera rotundifolia]
MFFLCGVDHAPEKRCFYRCSGGHIWYISDDETTLCHACNNWMTVEEQYITGETDNIGLGEKSGNG